MKGPGFEVPRLAEGFSKMIAIGTINVFELFGHGFTEAFGGFACRSCQGHVRKRDASVFWMQPGEDPKDGEHQGGLSGPGTTGDDGKAAGESSFKGHLLFGAFGAIHRKGHVQEDLRDVGVGR